MKKIRLIGLSLFAVFAFGAVVASSASAELVTGGAPAFWLVKGEAPATGVELGADMEGELEFEHLTLAAILCGSLIRRYDLQQRGTWRRFNKYDLELKSKSGFNRITDRSQMYVCQNLRSRRCRILYGEPAMVNLLDINDVRF